MFTFNYNSRLQQSETKAPSTPIIKPHSPPYLIIKEIAQKPCIPKRGSTRPGSSSRDTPNKAAHSQGRVRVTYIYVYIEPRKDFRERGTMRPSHARPQNTGNWVVARKLCSNARGPIKKNGLGNDLPCYTRGATSDTET